VGEKRLQKHTDIIDNDNVLFCETLIQSKRVIILSLLCYYISLMIIFSEFQWHIVVKNLFNVE
jgi:hypothetical protein